MHPRVINVATSTKPPQDPRPQLQPRRQHLELTANGELILAGGPGNSYRFTELGAANNPPAGPAC